MNQQYLNYNQVLRKEFGERIQKISINAGFTCPNRDGSKGVGGCTYCNNQTFIPKYCKPIKSVFQQINEGIDFFKHKYPTQKYFAYFQSYTNTYGDLQHLKDIYEEALAHPQVVGLVVGTRPDCVNDEILDYFAELNQKYYVMIEYGVESTNNRTLDLINRGHNFECSVEAIKKTHERGIRTGGHLILGLPSESREEILEHALKMSELPITIIKLHQLQIIRKTIMESQLEKYPKWFNLMSAEEYVELVIDFMELLNPKIAIERFISQSPRDLLIAPHWELKNFEFIHKVQKRIAERNTWQGKKYEK